MNFVIALLFGIAIFQGAGVQIQIWEYQRLKSKEMILSTWRSNLSYFCLIVSIVLFLRLVEEGQKQGFITWAILQSPWVSYGVIPLFTGVFLGVAPTFYAFQAYREKEKMLEQNRNNAQ